MSVIYKKEGLKIYREETKAQPAMVKYEINKTARVVVLTSEIAELETKLTALKKEKTDLGKL